MKKLTTKQITLMSVFAAILVIVSRLPGIPLIGVEGGHIEFTACLYPFMGIVLGPWVGMVAVLLGNFIVWLIPTATVFGLLMIPAGAIAALVSGFLSRKDGISNWKSAAVVLAILDILWYLTPVGFEAPFFPILHWIALALILVFRNKIEEYMESPSSKKLTLGVALSSFIATMAEHMTGNLIFIYAVGLVVPLTALRDALKALGMLVKLGPINLPQELLATIFMAILPVMTIERIAITAIATIVAVSAIRILGRSRLLVLPSES